MKCKSPICDLISGHMGRCRRLTDAINADAINKNTEAAMLAIANKMGKPACGEARVADRSQNRRKRSDYNAYMREYMKAYRKN